MILAKAKYIEIYSMYTITLTSAKWYKAHDLYEVYVYGIRQILLIHNKRDKKKNCPLALENIHWNRWGNKTPNADEYTVTSDKYFFIKNNFKKTFHFSRCDIHNIKIFKIPKHFCDFRSPKVKQGRL